MSMTSEVERIKKFVTKDMVVDAVELPANHNKKSQLIEDLEDVLSNFDDDANYAHFVVRVKRGEKALPILATSEEADGEKITENFSTNISTNFSSNFSIDALVNETLDISNEITESREKIEIEEATTDSFDAGYLLENAKILVANGDTELARNIYRALIKKAQSVAQAMAGMAKSYENESNFVEAIRFYEEAIAYSPEIEFYQALTALLIRYGNDKYACEVLERSLLIPMVSDTQKFDFHKSLGNCYTRLNLHEKAEAHYLSAYEINSDSDSLQVNVGTLAFQKNDYASAKNHFDRALELNMKNDKAITGLGMIHLMKSELKEAHQKFIDALIVNPDNLNAIFNLVKAAYEVKSYKDAAYFLRNYLSNHDANINILYSYAGILYHQGEVVLAEKEVGKILNLNPNHAGAQELKELIQQKMS